jgi:hypothetical protein
MGRNRYDMDSVTRVVDRLIDGDPARRDEAAGSGLGGRYARHGKPCCLVGEVLVALGASVGTLKELDKENEQISDSRHPFWRRFDPVTREFLSAMQKKNDRGEQWGRIKWELFRIDPYWVKANPKFAYPGPWCTNENGHVAEWSEAPKF